MDGLERETRRLYRLFDLLEEQIVYFRKCCSRCSVVLQSMHTLVRQLQDMKWNGDNLLSETIMYWLSDNDREAPRKLIEKMSTLIEGYLDECRKQM